MDLQTYPSFTIEPNVGSLSVIAVNDTWEIESGSSILVAGPTATAQATATHHTIFNSSAQAARPAGKDVAAYLAKDAYRDTASCSITGFEHRAKSSGSNI